VSSSASLLLDVIKAVVCNEFGFEYEFIGRRLLAAKLRINSGAVFRPMVDVA
jgi:hypothetical protein